MRLIKEYCCCAIPLLNAGIYLTLMEQFVVSITAGVLAFATPPIVGASVPGFVPAVFAALCFVAAGVQTFGFLGVFRESTIIFRRYTTLHSFITTAIFAFSAVFIGISASKHDSAAAKCVTTFFPADPSSTATALTGSDSEGRILCNIFTWVGIGTMAGLWAVLAIFHAYLFFVISGYGSNQRADHSKYYSLYSVNSYPGPESGAHPSFLPPDHIGMRNMGNDDAWDTRESMDTVGFEKQQAYPQQQPQYQNDPAAYSQHQQQYQNDPAAYPQHQQQYQNGSTTYPPPQRQASGGTLYPGAARTMSPAPTPAYHNGYQDPYYNYAEAGGMSRPDPSMRHPAEGSFRRKTPRMTPAPQARPYPGGNFDQSFFGPR